MATSAEWQLARGAAERYERILVPAILGPVAQALVDWCPLRTGDNVLDVGCGTGVAARLAAERVRQRGRVVGIDVNAGMLEVARSLRPPLGASIEWHESTAYELPRPDGTVDVVLCAQTLQFLTDRLLALSEMRRVLKPGGLVALSTWCALRDNPYFAALVDAVGRHIGPGTAAGLNAAFGLSDAAEIDALLEKAGFRSVAITRKRLDLELPKPGDFVSRHISATPMAVGVGAASRAARQAITEDVSAQLTAYETHAGLRVPFFCLLAMAAK